MSNWLRRVIRILEALGKTIVNHWRRIAIGALQVLAGTVIGYLAWRGSLKMLLGLYLVSLLIRLMIDALVVIAIGLAFRMRRGWWAALIGVGIGGLLGMMIVRIPHASTIFWLWALTMILPNLLATIAYHWAFLKALARRKRW